MKVYFILVEPQLPENLGAVARALKTMGFQFLRLVNPCDHLGERAKWVAHGSAEILENAELFSSLDNALEDLDIIVGTTARNRAYKRCILNPAELLNVIQIKQKILSKVGIVFGAESSGLSNKALGKCDLVSTILMRSKYPSLNLAQAVMIYAYSISPLINDNSPQTTTVSDQTKMKKLRGAVNGLLEKTGITKETNVHRRIMEKLSTMGDEDLRLLHFIIKRLNQQQTNRQFKNSR